MGSRREAADLMELHCAEREDVAVVDLMHLILPDKTNNEGRDERLICIA